MNRSVTKAIRLLEELVRFKKPVALKDLAHNAQLNKATAFRLLNSLLQKGLVHKIGNHGFYALGPKLLAFAEEYRRSFTMRDAVLPYLEQLVHATGRPRSTVNDLIMILVSRLRGVKALITRVRL
jgi:IclR family acetate operon transcriptional repressor